MNTQQGGWIANFLIIGAVLVLGLVGTVYLVKSQSMDGEIAKTDNDLSQSETSDEPAITEKDKSVDKNKDDSEAKPTEEKADSPAAPSQQPAASADENAEEKADVTEELPVTGPAETASSLFALGLIAFSAVSYVRSRSA